MIMIIVMLLLILIVVIRAMRRRAALRPGLDAALREGRRPAEDLPVVPCFCDYYACAVFVVCSILCYLSS